jgi:hypothetical protein
MSNKLLIVTLTHVLAIVLENTSDILNQCLLLRIYLDSYQTVRWLVLSLYSMTLANSASSLSK